MLPDKEKLLSLQTLITLQACSRPPFHVKKFNLAGRIVSRETSPSRQNRELSGQVKKDHKQSQDDQAGRAGQGPAQHQVRDIEE